MEDLEPIAYTLRLNTINKLDVFVKKSFKDLAINTLIDFKKKFSITINCYIVMSDHISLIITPDNHREFGIICEKLKLLLSQRVMEVLENNGLSDKRWLLFLINFINKDNSETGGNRIWCLDNPVKSLFSETEVEESINAIYFEPVEEGIVEKPEHYNYSSCKENIVEQLIFDRQAV